MFCPNCGNKLEDGANFCGRCGHTKRTADTEPHTSQTPSAELSDQDIIEAARQYMPETVVEHSSAPEAVPVQSTVPEAVQKTPKKKKLLPVIAAVLSVAVVATVVGAFVVPKLSKEGTTAADSDFQLMSSLVAVGKNGKYEQRVTYNDKGFIEEELYTDSAGYQTKKYYYDNQDNLIKTVTAHSGGTEKSTEYNYDENGNCIEKAVYSDGVKEKSNTYKYDSAGNKTEDAEFDGNDNLKHKYIYKYNSSGDITEEETYPNGSGSRKEYKYNSDGNVVETTYYYSDGSTQKYEYKYNSDGNLTEQIHSVDNIIYTTTKTDYDSKGNKTEIVCYSDFGNIEWRYAYSYDGNTVCRVAYDEDGEISYRLTCKFDDNGNIVEKINEKDGEISKETYSYNECNQLAENVSYKNGEETTRITIEFSDSKIDKGKAEKIKTQQEDVFTLISLLVLLDREDV